MEPIAFGADTGIAHEDAPNSPVLFHIGEGTTGDFASIPPKALTLYVLEWGITWESRLM